MSRPRRSVRVLPVVLLSSVLLSSALAAGSAEVSTRFFNSVDIASWTSCSWGPGRAAPNREVEMALRAQIEASLERKGYAMTTGDADCTVRSSAIREGNFPIGMLVVEVHDRVSNLRAWRGEATGLVNYDTKQLKKKARKIVKEMFKDFPESR